MLETAGVGVLALGKAGLALVWWMGNQGDLCRVSAYMDRSFHRRGLKLPGASAEHSLWSIQERD